MPGKILVAILGSISGHFAQVHWEASALYNLGGGSPSSIIVVSWCIESRLYIECFEYWHYHTLWGICISWVHTNGGCFKYWNLRYAILTIATSRWVSDLGIDGSVLEDKFSGVMWLDIFLLHAAFCLPCFYCILLQHFCLALLFCIFLM